VASWRGQKKNGLASCASLASRVPRLAALAHPTAGHADPEGESSKPAYTIGIPPEGKAKEKEREAGCMYSCVLKREGDCASWENKAGKEAHVDGLRALHAVLNRMVVGGGGCGEGKRQRSQKENERRQGTRGARTRKRGEKEKGKEGQERKPPHQCRRKSSPSLGLPTALPT